MPEDKELAPTELEKKETQTIDPPPGSIEEPKKKQEFDFVAMLQESNRSLREEFAKQQDEVERLKAEAQAKQEQAAAAAGDKSFFDTPASLVRGIVREELKAAVAPLLDFKRSVESGNKYTQLKQRFASNPMYAKILSNSSLERLLDESLSKVTDLNEQTMALALNNIGFAAMHGQIPGVSLAETPTTPAKITGDTPVHMRPSTVPVPIPKKEDAKRPLTEMEKRLARENGMSDEEYLAMLSSPADGFMHEKKEGK